MNLKCVDSGKFANLTKGNEYEGIEEGEFYIVANNMGARAKYAKKYFREVKPTAANAAAQRAAAREAAAPPPPPPAPDMMTTLTVNVVRGNGNRITYAIGGIPGRPLPLEGSLSIAGSQISCGIFELTGVNGIQAVINAAFNATPNTWRNRNLAELTGRVMDAIMAVVRQQQCLYILASDQIVADDVHAYLQQASETTASGLNPNSNNQIALYIIPRVVVTENAR